MATKQLGLLVVLLICITTGISKDLSTFANVDDIWQKKIEINFKVDFERKIIDGKMKIYFEPKRTGDMIILDTKNLNIKSIIDSNTGMEVEYEFDTENRLEHLGTPLKIYYPYHVSSEESFALLINYSTTDKSSAVQWLEPSMTSGKEYPFMFTQCETIVCRSLLPCQDTPSIKLLLSASVTVKNPLYGLNAAIYQSQIKSETDTTFFYNLNIPIPTYLIALAAGNIEERKISDRTTVYAEKEVVDLAAEEFSDTEEFIRLAESYVFRYQWGQANILVLPPSFPYGGMENPTLTFATPSILAGDKSLANVIAHEIAHSWSGDLVTNANWNNFWLNEGYTVFLERKILELKYKEDGKDFAKLASLIGKSDWDADVYAFGETHSFTTLNPNLYGKDPDDAFSSVAYERGYNLVYFLETVINNADPQKRDIFKLIVRSYFEKFKFQSIQYEDMRKHVEDQIKELLPEQTEEILKQIHWDDWVNTLGFPKTKNDFTNKYSTEITGKIADFFNNKLDDTFVDTFQKWHTNLKLFFLNHIIEDDKGSALTEEQYNFLKDKLNLKEGYNSEVSFAFLMLALSNKKLDIEKQLHAFLENFGRMKFIRPLYKSYAIINKADAVALFNKLKTGYHPIAVRLIESDLKKIN